MGIGAEAKKELRRMAGKPCEYCRRPMSAPSQAHSPNEVTRDHYHPRAHGYRLSDPGNKKFACRYCNELKGDMTPAQWTKFMEENPRWWGPPAQVSPRGSGLQDAAATMARLRARDAEKASGFTPTPIAAPDGGST